MTTAAIQQRRIRDSHAVQGAKKNAVKYGPRIMAGVFFGCATLICGAFTIELFMVGGFYGILGGILYLGFTTMNAYCTYLYGFVGHKVF